MNDTILKTRIIQKHDIEANWIKAGNAANPFIPLKGELIVYDDLDKDGNKVADAIRYKIGNGISNINVLPFIESSGIYDVISLPEVGEDTKFYRLLKATLIEKQVRRTDCSCTVVEDFPELTTPSGHLIPEQSIISNEDLIKYSQTGEFPVRFNVYYKLNDKAYAYIPQALGQAFGLTANWYDLTLIKNFVPALTYLGTITDITENDVENGNFNILLEYALYWYKDGVWNTFEQIGMIGEGPSAVKFNHPANIASGRASAAFGDKTKATGSDSFTEGYLTEASEKSAHAEGSETIASGPHSHAEGYKTKADGNSAHAEGNNTEASGIADHAEGQGSKATGGKSHAEGYKTEATEIASHAEGYETKASGQTSHAEGNLTIASGVTSHAEGERTTASGYNSHAEGYNTVAQGSAAHAEGYNTVSYGYGSHAEGGASKAYAMYSHAGGEWSIAGNENQDPSTDENSCSFAHGYKAIANGKAAISLGHEVIANADYQTVVGSFNSENPYALFIVGNGVNNETRGNAFVVHKDGRAEVSADPINRMDVVNKAYVDEVKEEVDNSLNQKTQVKFITWEDND